MGIQSDGMFGGFHGKTGPLVGRRVKGRSIVTGLHHPSTKPNTMKQVKQQDHFTLLTQFFLKIRNLVAIGFLAYAKRGNALNAAYKFNYPHAFIANDSSAEGEEIRLNFPALVYSRGNVATPNCPAVMLSAEQAEEGFQAQPAIVFSWLPEAQSLYNQSTDLATFVVYNETRQRFVFKQHGAARSALSYTMPLPGTSSGDRVYCYMNFNNASGKLAGDSVYIGTFVL